MNRPLNVIAWTLLGTVIGLGGGYLKYVKTPPLFMSHARILLQPLSTGPNHNPAESSAIAIQGNESALMQREDLVTSAIATTNLHALPEVQQRFDAATSSPDVLARRFLDQRLIKVSLEGIASQGNVYDLSYLGPTPTISQKFVAAWLATYQASLNTQDTTTQWQESLDLLTGARQEIANRIQQLEQARAQLPSLQGVTQQNGRLVSAEAERNKALRRQADEFQDILIQLRAKVSRTEALILAGGSTDEAMAALNQPLALQTHRQAMMKQVPM